MLIWVIVAVTLVGLLAGDVLAFNGGARRRNRPAEAWSETAEAWSETDVALKRLHDLIPSLVETLKGVASR
jgi:LemA protein